MGIQCNHDQETLHTFLGTAGIVIILIVAVVTGKCPRKCALWNKSRSDLVKSKSASSLGNSKQLLVANSRPGSIFCLYILCHLVFDLWKRIHHFLRKASRHMHKNDKNAQQKQIKPFSMANKSGICPTGVDKSRIRLSIGVQRSAGWGFAERIQMGAEAWDHASFNASFKSPWSLRTSLPQTATRRVSERPFEKLVR